MMFIGGPADGRVIELHDNCDTFETIPLEKIPASIRSQFVVSTTELKKVRYNKMPFKGEDGETRFVMAEEGLSSDDVIRLLINNYNPITWQIVDH